MSRLFPFRTPIDLGEKRAARLVDVDEEVADEAHDFIGQCLDQL